ncbi:histone lysine acetyltransferase HAT1 [Cardiosporidium cionae]|uniref:histone acetyltransferase n=1 Tax=Cardiosporidium cionae TaxID=476202 RepID=A0ABQ7J5K1_9APIC|nr:histone lysine acetyltransferase HAT1 [Cardiosporidium cionae]|eukprot:KAF8818383.1 histone lysine acetyltransferase HAT1 [Cardiosporidium cionae]
MPSPVPPPPSISVPSSTTASSASICRLDPLSVIRFLPVQTEEEFRHPVVHFSPLFAHHFFGEDNFIWGFEADLLISFYFIPFSFEVFLSIDGRPLPHLEDSTLPLLSLRRSLCHRTPFPGGLIDDAEQFKKILRERQTHSFFPPGRILFEIPFPLKGKRRKQQCPSRPAFTIPSEEVGRKPCLTPLCDFPPSHTLLQIRECTFHCSEEGNDGTYASLWDDHPVPIVESTPPRLRRISPSSAERLPSPPSEDRTEFIISENSKKRENSLLPIQGTLTSSDIPHEGNPSPASSNSEKINELAKEQTDVRPYRRTRTRRSSDTRKRRQSSPIKTDDAPVITSSTPLEGEINVSVVCPSIEEYNSPLNPGSVSFPLLHRRMEWFLHWFIESASPIESDERWRILLPYIVSSSSTGISSSSILRKSAVGSGRTLARKTARDTAPSPGSLPASLLSATSIKIPPMHASPISAASPPYKRFAVSAAKEAAGDENPKKEIMRSATLRSGGHSCTSKKISTPLSPKMDTRALKKRNSFSLPLETIPRSKIPLQRKQRGNPSRVEEKEKIEEDDQEEVTMKKSLRIHTGKPRKKAALSTLPSLTSYVNGDPPSSHDAPLLSSETHHFRFHLAGFATTYTFFSINQNRRRISQFMVFPHMQKRGIGMELLEQIYYAAIRDEKVCEITVEDPASTFTQLRDIVSLKLCFDSHQLPISCLYPPPSSSSVIKAEKRSTTKKLSKISEGFSSSLCYSNGYERKELIQMTKETAKQATRMRETLLLAHALPHPLPKSSFPLDSSSESNSTSQRLSNELLPSSSPLLSSGGSSSPTIIKDSCYPSTMEETRLENSDILKEVRIQIKKRLKREHLDDFAEFPGVGLSCGGNDMYKEMVKAELQRKWLEHFTVYYRTIHKLRSLFPL